MRLCTERGGRLSLVLMALCLSGSGCVHSWQKVPTAELETRGVAIEAEDGSFKIVAGKRFTPPFYSENCVVIPTTKNFGWAEHYGARRVRVKVPGLTEKLYGILAFCEVHPFTRGPVVRSYLMKVPSGRVAETEGGRISFEYEETDRGRTIGGRRRMYHAWQLWLSRIPFPETR